MTAAQDTAAAAATLRRRCSGYILDKTAKGGRRPCGLYLHPALAALGMLTHPCCDPAETWCLACGRGPGGCFCGTPRYARPRLAAAPPPPPPALPSARRMTPAERLADMHRRGFVVCLRPGAKVTHDELDALEEFARLLAERGPHPNGGRARVPARRQPAR